MSVTVTVPVETHTHHEHDRNNHDHLDHSTGHDHNSTRKRARAHCHDHNDDHDGCGHDHDSGWRKYLPHSHGLEARLRADKRSLQLALFILFCAFLVQLIGGYVANSSVLVLEAVHSALDGITVVISLISVTVATRAPTRRFSYGFSRAEVVSALVSVIALALLCVKLFVGGVVNLVQILSGGDGAREVEGRVIIAAEGVTLVANMFIAVVLTRGSGTLNIRALRGHVVADCVENFVVLIAGLVLTVRKGWGIIDPVLTLLIVGVIVGLNWGIGNEAVSMLLQGSPEEVDLERIVAQVGKVEGVRQVRRTHVWTLTAGAFVGSCVIGVGEKVGVRGFERIRKEVEEVFEDVGVGDVTVEVCLEDARDEEERWGVDEGDGRGQKDGYALVGSDEDEHIV